MVELFHELVSGRGALEPWLPKLKHLLGTLEGYRQLGPAKKEDLWQWYALSRVNEVLIGGLVSELPHRATHLRQDVQRRDALFQHESLVHGQVPKISAADYRAFFETLGFELFEGGAFSPFHHEIVEVIEDGSAGITVEHTFWPGLKFGELLFARAGVRVRSGALNKAVAERSPLYFTWWRAHRDTEDLSHGWGSSSQWRTEMRRDYQSAGKLHYNVDGKWAVEDLSHGDSDLGADERIELLTHRSFVRSTKRPWGRWPFGDRYLESSATTTV
jgi:hypothetical protein